MVQTGHDILLPISTM